MYTFLVFSLTTKAHWNFLQVSHPSVRPQFIWKRCSSTSRPIFYDGKTCNHAPNFVLILFLFLGQFHNTDVVFLLCLIFLSYFVSHTCILSVQDLNLWTVLLQIIETAVQEERKVVRLWSTRLCIPMQIGGLACFIIEFWN